MAPVPYSEQCCGLVRVIVSLLTSQNCGQGSDKPLLLFLANKVDLEVQRVVPMATGEEEAKKYGARFAEVSALSGDKVEEVT